MLSFKMEGMDELHKKLNDMTNPSGEFVKEGILDKICENVPEAIAERGRIKMNPTGTGFEVEVTDVSPEIGVKIKEFLETWDK